LASAGETGLLFLDDLFHPFEVDESRDPWSERLETDRHDFTQAPTTVGRGVGLVELGYTYFYADRYGEIENAHTAPEILCRVGLTQDIELRVRWDYAWSTFREEHGETREADGAEDLRWGLKLGISEEAGCIPVSALEIMFTAPTGGRPWNTEHVQFGFHYIYAWDIAPDWNLAGSSGLLTQGWGDFGVLPEEPADDRFLMWVQSVALGRDISENNTIYLEWYGLFSHALEDEFSIAYFNVGIDHYFTDNLVVDFRVGMGLTEDSDDLFAGIGGGIRF
jgi:hypothetical protein